jgi:hypothetical protein
LTSPTDDPPGIAAVIARLAIRSSNLSRPGILRRTGATKGTQSYFRFAKVDLNFIKHDHTLKSEDFWQ